LKLKDIWAIRVRLQIGERTRELALFNLAIDSKLRSCDLVKLRVRDVCHGSLVAARAMVMQQKTQRPVQFEVTEQTRESLLAWIRAAGRRSDDYLFPSRIHGSPHLSTRQVRANRSSLGSGDRSRLERVRNPYDAAYEGIPDLSTHQKSAGGAAAARSYEIGEHRAYLGIEVDDALEMAEQTEV
jgi:integrase